MKRRIGKFSLPFKDVEDCSHETRGIMGFMSVLRAEAILHESKVEYVAISPLFKELPDEYMIPEYDVFISESGQTKAFIKSND